MLKVSWVKNDASQFGRIFVKCNCLIGILQVVRKENSGGTSGLVLLNACTVATFQRIRLESISKSKSA